MSFVLPVMYHWSRRTARPMIQAEGLKPTTATAPRGEGESFPAVCLGTSASHAWNLSGNAFGEPGERWDLWQVVLAETDDVHPLPCTHRLGELRVGNVIGPDRLWLVGSRTADFL